MIIKKPYAFFIKHFKIIHLLLMIPILYLAFKIGDISSFFKSYVYANYQTSEVDFVGNYITLLIYLAIFVLIIINVIIYLLMRSKQKNTLYYTISILFYILILASTLVFYYSMTSIDMGTLSQTVATFIKDYSSILVVACYIILLVTFLKGIGFNIKTLRIDNYLGLQATEEDEEEIELKLNSDNNKVKKNIVHYIRELKYYVLENKFVFSCLGLAAIIGIVISIYMNYQVYNKRYNLHEAFALDNFNMTLKESYITDVDFSGNKITDGYYYLAVKIGITNKSLSDESIDKANFKIYIDNESIFPKYDRSSRFVDIGRSYQGNTILAGSSDDYVFVYELTEKMIKNQYKMKILSDLKQDGNKLKPSYKIINIKPTNITKTERIIDSSIDKEIALTDTMLGNTIYTLKSFEFSNGYQYTYNSCNSNNDCQDYKDVVLPHQGKSLLLIEDNIKWDEETSYYKNTKHKFYEDYAIVVYKYNGTEYQTRLTDVTPSNLKDKKVFEIPEILSKTSKGSMKLFFKIRNKIISIEVT